MMKKDNSDFIPATSKDNLSILIVGGGGREHALAWKIAQSPFVKKIFMAPGNGGTAGLQKCENIAIDAKDIPALLDFAQKQSIDLTVVGPEDPLAVGIVDEFTQNDLICFGPTKDGAQIEASKVFAKKFMEKNNIPTAKYRICESYQDAERIIHQQSTFPLVIKADGLAAGKGVIIASTKEEALHAAHEILVEKAFGSAGEYILIEEYIGGKEVSFMVMTDGKHIVPFATSQDNKPLENYDRGPNTGGMGAYSPNPIVTHELHNRIMDEIIKPTLEGFNTLGITYTGFLYAGLMITPQGDPYVLEFNCRLGDPETQPILMRLKTDLVPLIYSCIFRKLDSAVIHWDSRCALGVVLASGGYPKKYKKGFCIEGLHATYPDVEIFHAGTTVSEKNIVTNGGRVLCVTALGNSMYEAQQKAYQQIASISWPEMYFRTDIGQKVISG